MRLTRLALLIFATTAIIAGTGSLSAQDSNKATDLDRQMLVAADNGDLHSVAQLLEKGADIEARGRYDSTALMMAAERGDLDMVKFLLDKGADASARDKSDETALVQATRSGNIEMLELLLQKTTDLRSKNNALFAAAESGAVVIHMEDAGPKPSNGSAATAASESPWLKTVRLLLDGGADLQARREDRSTPLLTAAAYAHTEIFIFLLERGADINARDKYGNNALIAAACQCASATMNSANDVIEILLHKGIDVNARNRDGNTALILAASMQGDPAVLKLLLDAGADLAAKNKRGETALAVATACRREDKIKVLKESGAHIR
jgi:ankyrin repeat protein